MPGKNALEFQSIRKWWSDCFSVAFHRDVLAADLQVLKAVSRFLVQLIGLPLNVRLEHFFCPVT